MLHPRPPTDQGPHHHSSPPNVQNSPLESVLPVANPNPVSPPESPAQPMDSSSTFQQQSSSTLNSDDGSTAGVERVLPDGRHGTKQREPPTAAAKTAPKRPRNDITQVRSTIASKFGTLLPTEKRPAPAPTRPTSTLSKLSDAPDLETRTIQAMARYLQVPRGNFKWKSPLQKQAAISVMSGKTTTIVLPTSAGKTACALAPLCLEKDDEVTVAVVPFTAIAEQYTAMANTLGIQVQTWSEGSEASAQLIIVVTEVAVLDEFLDIVSGINDSRRLVRVVIDEAHMSADPSHTSFRRAFSLLYRLTTLPIQKVLLTGTLPPHRMQAYRNAFILPPHAVVRDKTTRENIRFSIKPVNYWKKEAFEIGDRAVRAGGKAIVFCFSVGLAEEMAKKHNHPCYHADVQEGDRKAILASFRSGEDPLLFATSSLGAGLDVEGVTTVVHAGAPHSMTDYLQETGRAGRNGDQAEAVMVIPRGATCYVYTESDVENLDKLLLGAYIDTNECLVAFQHAYLDKGTGANITRMCSDTAMCSNCAIKTGDRRGFTNGKVSYPLSCTSSASHADLCCHVDSSTKSILARQLGNVDCTDRR